MKKVAMIIFLLTTISTDQIMCMQNTHTCRQCPKMSFCTHITALMEQKKSLEEHYENIHNGCTLIFCGKTDCCSCNQYFQKKINAHQEISDVCLKIAMISSEREKNIYFKATSPLCELYLGSLKNLK